MCTQVSEQPKCEAFIMTGEQILKTYTTKSRKAAMLAHEQQKQQSHLHEPPPPSSQPADGERENCDQSQGTRHSQINPEANNPMKSKDCEHQATPATNKRQDLPPKPQPRASQMDHQHNNNNNNNNNHHHHLHKNQPAVLTTTTPGTPVVRTGTFTRGQLKQDSNNSYKLNGGQKLEEGDFSIQFKTGFLSRKRTLDARGKPTSRGRRGWRRVYVILRDLRFIMRDGNKHQELVDQENDKQANEEQHQQQQQQQQSSKQNKKQQLAAKDLKNAIKLHHAFAKKSSSYTKRDYVFHLQLADQSELLLQADSEEEMNSWINTINFASACLSSPPLPSAVTNSKRYLQSSTRYYRPKLPASYTKLSYWEQLTDHEERLERLKTELEELLNEAPVKRNADKHSKSDFIDKIAYLRQKIEHYTVYLDLMQKKSNSHEAIILSKHPQIASLTPSREMVQSLPLYAKAHDDNEDKKDAN